ncbi:DUF2993 domain-containing protein [Actinoplanes sp. NPDC051470]|uniref:LmeA family phospholipid-binding protein n=1 Tax=unclassified Actinoplanes TaxID=2626549 RepID=UPI0034121C17
MAEVYGQSKPRRRWGRRLLVTLIVLLIILGLIAVVADRLGASYAERMIGDRVAQQVADQKATSAEPQVTIKGVPFLTQVLRGEYQEIQIQLADFAGPAGNGKTIKMPVLDVRARDVRAPLDTVRSGQGDIVAGTITGTGTVDYVTLAELSDQQGIKLAEQGGKLAVTAPVKILNQTVTVNGTANLEVAKDNVVRVRFEQVTAEGLPDVPLVRGALNNYARQLSIDVPVPALPLQLKVEKVQPTPNGLAVTASAKEVPLNGAS